MLLRCYHALVHLNDPASPRNQRVRRGRLLWAPQPTALTTGDSEVARMMRQAFVVAALASAVMSGCGSGSDTGSGCTPVCYQEVCTPPSRARFTVTLLGRGSITRRAGNLLHFRMPTVYVEETAGVGSRFTGWCSVDVHYVTTRGTQEHDSPHLTVADCPAGRRLEGKATTPFELAFDVSLPSAREQDWLDRVSWTINLQPDDASAGDWTWLVVIAGKELFDGPGA